MLKNAGLQGSTLSDHRMTTGFGPFELPTCGLLQRGRDHSPPKVCFIWGAQLLVGFQSIISIITVAKQNGGGVEWVELFIKLTKGMGEPTYGLLLSLIMSWWSRLVQRVLHWRYFWLLTSFSVSSLYSSFCHFKAEDKQDFLASVFMFGSARFWLM